MATIVELLFKKETASKSAMICLLFTVGQRIVLSAVGIFIARWLGPREYGVYTLAFVFVPLVVSIGKLGIGSAYTRYIPRYESKGMLKAFLIRSYGITCIGCTATCCICIWWGEPISRALFAAKGYSEVLTLGCICAAGCVIYENLLYTFYGMRVFKTGYALSLFVSVVASTLGIGMIWHRPQTDVLLISNTIAYAPEIHADLV